MKHWDAHDTEAGAFRDRYLASEPTFARLHLTDSHMETDPKDQPPEPPPPQEEHPPPFEPDFEITVLERRKSWRREEAFRRAVRERQECRPG